MPNNAESVSVKEMELVEPNVFEVRTRLFSTTETTAPVTCAEIIVAQLTAVSQFEAK